MEAGQNSFIFVPSITFWLHIPRKSRSSRRNSPALLACPNHARTGEFDDARSQTVWIVITVAVVIEPTTGMSVTKGLLRLLGTGLAGIIALVSVLMTAPLARQAGSYADVAGIGFMATNVALLFLYGSVAVALKLAYVR